MRWLAFVVLLGGCDLYFGHDSPHPIVGDPDGPSAQPGLAADCLRTVAAGALIPSGSVLPSASNAVFYTHVCQPDGGAIIGVAWVEGGVLVHGTEHADFQDAFKRTIPGDFDGYGGVDMFSLDAHRNGMWVFTQFTHDGVGGMTVGMPFAFDDVIATDLDGDGQRDLVVTGNNAVQYTTVSPYGVPGDIKPVLTGKPYLYIAQTELGGDAQPDLFYVASAANQPIELGTAIRTAATPPTYTLSATTTEPGGSALPLVTADVDGDGIADVIGATSHVFVRSTRYHALVILEEPAVAIAVGDVDGDGVAEPLFITGDRQSVRRVRIGTQAGQLKMSSEPLVADGGDQLAVADLDGDKRADLILMKGVGQPGSRLVFHSSTTY